MKTKRRNLILVAVLAVIGLACVIGGVSYALFNYYKKGTIENDVTTGKITFRYDETGVKGIDLQGATPILDKDGIELSNEGEYFDFTVSTKGTDKAIGYTINAEVLDSSTLPTDAIKLYLTEVKDNEEKYVREWLNMKKLIDVCSINDNGTIKTYNDYEDSTEPNTKKICGNYFNATSEEQSRTYRLRAWIDKNTDFSPEKNEDGTYKEDENGEYIYPYNNKSIKIRINVQASAITREYFGYGDTALTMCNSEGCGAGSSITLPDNSEWVVTKSYNKGDDAITLLSKKYIDRDGNYSDNPLERDKTGISTEELINGVLENYSNKVKSVLPNTTVTVSLPSAEILGFEGFDPNNSIADSEHDNYYYINICESSRYDIAADKPLDNVCNGKYVLSDDNYHWLVDNSILKYEMNYDFDLNNPFYAYQAIRPVITIPGSYFDANYSNSTIK